MLKIQRKIMIGKFNYVPYKTHGLYDNASVIKIENVNGSNGVTKLVVLSFLAKHIHEFYRYY
jgi:hypothetical protein